MTETTKHTPGPWATPGKDKERPQIRVYSPGKAADGGDQEIAGVYQGLMGNSEYEANAKLIAAAPELAEQLNRCLAALSDEVACRIDPKLKEMGGTDVAWTLEIMRDAIKVTEKAGVPFRLGQRTTSEVLSLMGSGMSAEEALAKATDKGVV